MTTSVTLTYHMTASFSTRGVTTLQCHPHTRIPSTILLSKLQPLKLPLCYPFPDHMSMLNATYGSDTNIKETRHPSHYAHTHDRNAHQPSEVMCAGRTLLINHYLALSNPLILGKLETSAVVWLEQRVQAMTEVIWLN